MQSVPLSYALVMFLGFVALQSHADMSGLFNHLRPAILRLTVHAATKDQEWVSGLDTAKGRVDVCGPCYSWSPCRCLVRASAWSRANAGGCRRTGPDPQQPPHDSLQLMAFGVDAGGERLFLPLGDWPLGIWPCSGEYRDNTQWTFSVGERSQGRGRTWKDREVNVMGAQCEILE